MKSIKNLYLLILPFFSGGLLIYWVHNMYVRMSSGSYNNLMLDVIIIGLLFTSFGSTLYANIKRRNDNKKTNQK